MSGDFFTVLCVGQGFTEDQWMNVYSFSMLHHWLLTYHSVSSGNTTADTGTALHVSVCIYFFNLKQKLVFFVVALTFDLMTGNVL